MPKKKDLKSSYNTNLAAEFYALSVLHRLGAEATLTLGNKKAVDIVVIRKAGDAVTIDVKGLAGKTGWPVDNVKKNNNRHFIIFVCFLDKIAEPTAQPEAYVVPSDRLEKFIYHAPGGRRLVRLSELQKNGQEFHDAWPLVL